MTDNNEMGRSSSALYEDLRSNLQKGDYSPGTYLPPVRTLSKSSGLALNTVNKVLKKLQSDGFVEAEPRKGYRVMARAADPDLGYPVAYLAGLPSSTETWKPLHQEFLSSFQAEASLRGWAFMGLGSQGKTSDEVRNQLINNRIGGLIVDSVEPEILEIINNSGLPCAAVDCADENLPIDSVVQDSYAGGLLAADYLAEKGHTKIAWMGPTAWSSHSLARVAGTYAGLLKHGIHLPSELTIDCPRDDCEQEADELLSRPERPTGIVALYREVAASLIKTARKKGLILGRDIEIVGWATEEQYERDWLPLFQEEPSQPAVVWSTRKMAEVAIERINVRRKNPDSAIVKICIPVELKHE